MRLLRAWPLGSEFWVPSRSFCAQTRNPLRGTQNSPQGRAEGEGFEPPGHCCPTVFKTAAINRSAIPPSGSIPTSKQLSGVGFRDGGYPERKPAPPVPAPDG